MASLFVDQTLGLDANSGTQLLPWKTVSKVNGETFSAGDSISFKKGELWREKLIPPSSGGAGNPITFDVYSSGSIPVINGADLVATWTAETTTEIDDETGATSYRIAHNNGNAMAEIPGFHASGLANYAGLDYRLTLHDSGANSAVAWIDVADAAESLGSNLPSGWTNRAGSLYETFNTTGLTIDQAENTSGFGVCWVNPSLTVGALYKVTFDFTLASGTHPQFRVSSNSVLSEDNRVDVQTVNGTNTFYFTAWTAATHVGFRTGSSDTNDFDVANFVESEVTNVGTTGVHLVSTKGGSTRDFESTGGMDFNDITTLEVEQVFSDNTFSATLTTDPSDFGPVALDDSYIFKGSGRAALADHEWFWEDDVLYIADATGNPDVTGVTVEAAASRNIGIDINGRDNITIDGLNAKFCNFYGVQIRNGSDNVTVRNSVLEANRRAGVWLPASGTACTGVLIDSNTISENGRMIIQAGAIGHAQIRVDNGSVAHSGTISNNTVSNASVVDQDDWGMEGMRLDSGSWTIERNIVRRTDHGIRIGDVAVNNTVIRYNLIHDTRDDGVFCEIWTTDTHNIYYNAIFNTGDDGIQVRGPANIYNNIVFGCSDGGVVCEDAGADYTVNIKNNILSENIVADEEAETPGEIYIFTSAFTITVNSDFNCVFHSAGGTFMHWKGVDYNWADWLTNSGGDASSINVDPLLVGPVDNNGRLKNSSPCIDVGTDVSLTEDFTGTAVPQGSLPDMGAYEFAALSFSRNLARPLARNLARII